MNFFVNQRPFAMQIEKKTFSQEDDNLLEIIM